MKTTRPHCSHRIRGEWGRSFSCTRYSAVERAGAHYCAQHDPVAIAKRREVQIEKGDQRLALSRIERHGPTLLEMLKLSRQYVADAASGLAPAGSPPLVVYKLLQEIDALVKSAEGKK